MGFSNSAYGVKVVVVPFAGEEVPSNWLGEWNAPNASYKKGDIVGYAGSSYIALTNHTSTVAQFPGSASNWDLVVEGGTNGLNGTDGDDGADGAPGADGNDGADGAPGTDGTNPTGCNQTACIDDTASFSCGDPIVSINIACVSPKKVFVSTSTTTGRIRHLATGGTLGLAGADNYCQADAVAAGLSGTYKAWLSSSVSTAAARLTHSASGYALISNTLIATSWDDLIDGQIMNPINADASGSPVSAINIWTGSAHDGSAFANRVCEGWETGAGLGRRGATTSTDSAWSSAGTGNCSFDDHSLYCFEQ